MNMEILSCPYNSKYIHSHAHIQIISAYTPTHGDASICKNPYLFIYIYIYTYLLIE